MPCRCGTPTTAAVVRSLLLCSVLFWHDLAAAALPASGTPGSACGQALADAVFSGVASAAATLPSQTQFHSAMCSESGVAAVGASGKGFGVRGFTLGDTLQEAHARRAAYKSSFCTVAPTVRQADVVVFTAWLDPNLLMGYQQCLSAEAAGLRVAHTINPERTLVNVALECVAGKGVTFYAATTAGPVKCVPLSLKAGAVLRPGGGIHTVQCRRTGPGVITVMITSSAGTQEIRVPGLAYVASEVSLQRQLNETRSELMALSASLRDTQQSLTDIGASASTFRFNFVCNPPFGSCPAEGPGDFVPCEPAFGAGTQLTPGLECRAPKAECEPGQRAIACNCVSYGGALAIASMEINRGSPGCSCLFVNPTTMTFSEGNSELRTLSIATCVDA